MEYKDKNTKYPFAMPIYLTGEQKTFLAWCKWEILKKKKITISYAEIIRLLINQAMARQEKGKAWLILHEDLIDNKKEN